MALPIDSVLTPPRATDAPRRTVLVLKGADASDPERVLFAPPRGCDTVLLDRGALAAGHATVTVGPTRFEAAAAATDGADAFVAESLRPLFASRLADLRFRRAHERAWRRRSAREAARLAGVLGSGDRAVLQGIDALGIASALPARDAPRLALLLDEGVPTAETLAQLPDHARLLGALARFELVAVPGERDASNLRAYCARELDATLLPGGGLRIRGRAIRIAVQPPGIDEHARATEAALAPRAAGAALFALDAVDPSRAIPQRLRAVSRVLARRPADDGRPGLLQLLARTATDPASRALRRRVLALATRINGRHGEPDWTPVSCVEFDGDRLALAGLQRAARVALCTPVADSATLAAQDWIACQDAATPGVLVLSRHAAAAAWLDGALLVDARDPDDIAAAIERALAMPLVERRNRWQCAWRALTSRDGGRWLDALLAHWRDEAPARPRALTRIPMARLPALPTISDPSR